ncbi:FAD/NAD(P)-binding oxidoreductase [Phytohabitans flavus]|uniref:Pyridine nucleotide-disulfide oxidoreductase n=1 Tax=Phytohabitans flavus TaxID=1076124 RepID=A0A6F8XNN3_9ACTN|nr:FAD-dependent oxidoreductase [Phytohabitans flavus]BCB75361.1 pyridine nucleotide-disulfide oxidoreductase [Phytohabitans flavus]
MSADVAVVGAGAAGLRAATVAALAGLSTVLVDSYERSGGQYYRQPVSTPHLPSRTQVEGRRLVDAAYTAGVELRNSTSVWDATVSPDGGVTLRLTSGDRLSTLECRALVVATGAHERVVPFPGWTLPGVYTAGAVQALHKAHGVAVGQRVLFAGTGPLLLVAAAGTRAVEVLEASRLAQAGARHPLATAAGLWRQGERLREGLGSAWRLRRAGTPLRTGWGIVRALGDDRVEGAVVARLDADWRPVRGSERALVCDAIATHYSLVPDTDLLRLLGAAMEHRPELGGWVPSRGPLMATSVPGVFAAGDCTGIGGAGLSLVEGELAGHGAVRHVTGREPRRLPLTALRRERRFQRLYGALFTPRPGLAVLARPDTVVCRCEEVTRGSVDAAMTAGARTVSSVKAVTRCGMGPCQGRICLPAVAQLTAAGPPPEARAPLVPVPFEAVASCG